MTNSTTSSSGCARPTLGENPRNRAARHSRVICSAAATISAKDTWLEMTIVERVARNVDHAAVQRMQQDEAARTTAERIAALRHIVFRNAASNRNVQGLTSETAAARLLTSAGDSADGFLVLGILRVAIDKRWHSVVLAGIRYFGEHPGRSPYPGALGPHHRPENGLNQHRKENAQMSLAQLESQIEDLRAQAASIQKRSARTSDILANDATLSDTGRQAKRDAERDRMRDQLRDLRKKETELIDAKKQTLEKRLFGLSAVASSDPGQVLLYRDSQDRAARLTQSDEAAQVFAAALRSDDKILAAAVLGRALDAGWHSIIDEYVKHNPSAGEDLKDLAKLRRYRSFEATIAYAWGA